MQGKRSDGQPKQPIRATDFVGRRFGRWTVLADGGKRGSTRLMLCACECGTVRLVRALALRGNTSLSCGCGNRGANHHAYNGGLCFVEGRWQIWCRDGTHMKYARAVMAAQIGRLLRPDEVVHHRNEITDDDRPENLLITTRSEHTQIHANDRSPELRAKFADATRQSWKSDSRRARYGLTWEKVREIRSLLAAGETPQNVADRFGVNRPVIYGIKRGRTWRED